ncbi:hypothetical protein [Simkania sp.]|uniref:hypothetical protein n=1 Tax=Simkania sp. TaxID=34094 RepID=UPI003B53011C
MAICLLLFPANLKANPLILQLHEKRVFSQCGEDGIIEYIFSQIGTSSKYYVEFGALDGHIASNTKYLREFKGWTGLLIDCSYENHQINLHKHFITAENINTLFELHHVPYDLDLLSIDIDGNDFYVWHALDEQYRPRLVVIEYNGNFPPNQSVVISYNSQHRWDGSRYFGANITAMQQLGRLKGYTLVYADSSGCNLFFIPDELVPDSFTDTNDVHVLYRAHCHPKSSEKK